MNFTGIIAYQEAGHAVVARVLGIAVPCVTILNGAQFAVRESAAWLARDDADRSVIVRAIENDAKVALAGMCAQLRYRPGTNQKRSGFVASMVRPLREQAQQYCFRMQNGVPVYGTAPDGIKEHGRLPLMVLLPDALEPTRCDIDSLAGMR